MKRIIAVLLALLLTASLAACHTVPPESPDSPETPAADLPAPGTTEAPSTEDITPPVPDEPEVDYSALQKLDSLPYRAEIAILKGSPIGGNPTLYVTDIGLTYYVSRRLSAADETAEYYKGTLTLPEGYENGRIIHIGAGAGSGEILLTVVAEKDGETAALDYLGLSDSLGQFAVHPRAEIPDLPLAHLVNVTENPGNLAVHTVMIPVKNENTACTSYAYDDRYRICLTYEVVQNDANGYRVHTDDLFIVDLATGEIVHEQTLDIDSRPSRVIYTEDGCILQDFTYNDGVYTTSSYKITEKDGTFTVTPVEQDMFPAAEQLLRSPNGTYTVYKTVEDGAGNGGIDVKYPDGSVRRILTHVMLGNSPACKAEDIGDVVGYTPIGFMDDTHLAYYIGGWEWVWGYGIYDLETGMATEYRDSYRALATYDGVLYIRQTFPNYDEVQTPGDLYKVSVDGTKEKLSDPSLSFSQSKWLRTQAETLGETKRIEKTTMTIFSPDMTTDLAQIEYYRPLHQHITYYIYENSVTFIHKQITR